MKKRIISVLLATVFALSVIGCGTKDTKEQDAYRQYGITCMESGKYEDAVKAFQNALGESIGHIGEKELDICFYKAKAQALDGKTKDALATYNAIIKYNKDARAYYLRGDLYMDMGEEKKGRADFESAVQHQIGVPLWTPSMPKPYYPHRIQQHEESLKVVYFPSCINQTMGTAKDSPDQTPLIDKDGRLAAKSRIRSHLSRKHEESLLRNNLGKQRYDGHCRPKIGRIGSCAIQGQQRREISCTLRPKSLSAPYARGHDPSKTI